MRGARRCFDQNRLQSFSSIHYHYGYEIANLAGVKYVMCKSLGHLICLSNVKTRQDHLPTPLFRKYSVSTSDHSSVKSDVSVMLKPSSSERSIDSISGILGAFFVLKYSHGD